MIDVRANKSFPTILTQREPTLSTFTTFRLFHANKCYLKSSRTINHLRTEFILKICIFCQDISQNICCNYDEKVKWMCLSFEVIHSTVYLLKIPASLLFLFVCFFLLSFWYYPVFTSVLFTPPYIECLGILHVTQIIKAHKS